MKILVTGAAGFIGMHVCKVLLSRGDDVIGIDNLNDYYDVNLKKARLDQLIISDHFIFKNLDITDADSIALLFKKEKLNKVIHLAAQAGVRYSIENPHVYINSNIQGYLNILEQCRHNEIEHLVYASSSSVYGSNTSLPFSENDNVDHPVSLYAATKKANELMAHTYSHLYNIPTTGLRFFTVYGPWGRPDMALFLFCKAMLSGQPINVFNHGEMQRDFTYIDDIAQSVVKILDKPAEKDMNFSTKVPSPSSSLSPYRVFNIGNSNPCSLMDYISSLEKALNINAEKIFVDMQPGDVKSTSSDTSKLDEWIGFKPKTSIDDGINDFVEWYMEYYQ